MAGAPFEMRVELGKVREFARAVKSSAGADLDDPTPVSAPTFLATATFWQDARHSAWGDTPRPMARVLHGSIEVIFPDGPPQAGAELVGTSRIDAVREKQGRRGGAMTFTDVVTDFRAHDGRLVASFTSTSIVTSRAPEAT